MPSSVEIIDHVTNCYEPSSEDAVSHDELDEWQGDVDARDTTDDVADIGDTLTKDRNAKSLEMQNTNVLDTILLRILMIRFMETLKLHNTMTPQFWSDTWQ